MDDKYRVIKLSDSVSLAIKDDGIYLFYTKEGTIIQSAEKQEVPRKTAELGIVDVDEQAVRNFFEEEYDREKDIRISSNLDSLRADAYADIHISKDQMEAVVTITAPGLLGKEITDERLRSKIKENGIMFGLDEQVIAGITRRVKYGERYVIAVGKPSVDGQNGTVDVKIDVNKKSNKPKELEDGRVDFKQVDFFLAAVPKQLLAVSIPPTYGEDGKNVLGQVVSAKPGKPAPKLPKGKNTEISDDGMSLFSLIGGHISITGNLINVLPILEIPGDVGNETGNVNFDGAVIIRGVVTTGFKVVATGDVEVRGMVEGATIEAGGHVKMLAGVQGVEKAVIRSGADINTKFAQHATLIAKRNIISDAILHCNVDCEGSVLLEGKKCLLVGGKIRAAKMVSAGIIGSSMATNTEVTVGNSPDILEKYNDAVAELMNMRKEYERVSQMVEQVLKLGNVADLPFEKKKLLHSAMNLKKDLREKITALQTTADELMSDMNMDKGEIKVKNVIYAGVKIVIGDLVKYVRDDIHFCTLKVFEGKIVAGQY
jgi:hypothetical protein